jgi:hypothetical protein
MFLSRGTHPTIWLDLALSVSFFGGFLGVFFWEEGGREGGNDNGFYMATSLYRSVDGSRLSLIRDLSMRGVYVPIVGCD